MSKIQMKYMLILFLIPMIGVINSAIIVDATEIPEAEITKETDNIGKLSVYLTDEKGYGISGAEFSVFNEKEKKLQHLKQMKMERDYQGSYL